MLIVFILQPTAVSNNPEFNKVPCSSFLGFGNGQSLGKLFGIVANGGTLQEKKLLSSNVINTIRTTKFDTPDIYGLVKDMGLGLYNMKAGKVLIYCIIFDHFDT